MEGNEPRVILEGGQVVLFNYVSEHSQFAIFAIATHYCVGHMYKDFVLSMARRWTHLARVVGSVLGVVFITNGWRPKREDMNEGPVLAQ